jgi:hypothetical protein
MLGFATLRPPERFRVSRSETLLKTIPRRLISYSDLKHQSSDSGAMRAAQVWEERQTSNGKIEKASEKMAPSDRGAISFNYNAKENADCLEFGPHVVCFDRAPVSLAVDPSWLNCAHMHHD